MTDHRHLFLYLVFGISIGLTISMLASSMNGMIWDNYYHESNSINIPGAGRGLTVKYTDKHDKHKNKDSNHHHDDDTITIQLKKKMRILCWIMTSPHTLKSKAKHVKHTWGKRCDVILFMSSRTDHKFPAIGLNTSEGRNHLTSKTMRAFRYIYKKHFNDADWFMKADDDTYVIMENLRYFLSSKDPNRPIYFGHHFTKIVRIGFHNGGAGYVLSKEALRRFGVLGNKKICREDDGSEDVEMGICLHKLNVTAAKTVDSLGRTRFHCYPAEQHVNGGYNDWYRSYDSNGARQGIDSMSDYAISFHHVKPMEMYTLEYFVYHLRPFGFGSGVQDLNM